MATIGFVACSKTKSLYKRPAAALYTSALFRKSLLAAIDRAEKVYILSAKHGLLGCNDVIEPYDVTLKTMKQAARMAWGERTGKQFDAVMRARDTAVLFCGEEYCAPLSSNLERLKVRVESPLGVLSLGMRLRVLAEINGEAELRRTATHFFHLLHQVWAAQAGGRRIDETNGRQIWPPRGVYFILAGHNVKRGRLPRIVRVGTHAVSRGSKTTLWDRLSTHRGTAAGGGSHRSSIFRLHIGRAWKHYSESETWPDTWAQGQSAPLGVRQGEERLEQQVSKLIGAMQVIWLDVGDEPGPESERAYLERNAIGLLSRIGLLHPGIDPDWLGQFSSDWRIAVSGLWNLNHVFRRPDPDFIERLTIAVERTIGRSLIAQPVDAHGGERQDQLSFALGGGER